MQLAGAFLKIIGMMNQDREAMSYFWRSLAMAAIKDPGRQSSDGDPGIAQKRPNCRSESTLDNFRSGSDRRLSAAE